jgi:hypothetical protein
MGRRKPAPGKWRILTYPTADTRHEDNGVGFDEIVLDHWLHVEQMDDREWWLQVGPLHISVIVDQTGNPRSVYLRDPDPEWTQLDVPTGQRWRAPKDGH